MPCVYSSADHCLLQKPQQRALGAAVAALGLSNKAVYAGDMVDLDQRQDAADVGGYTDGPDLAPNAMPAAVQGGGTELMTVCCMHSCAMIPGMLAAVQICLLACSD